MAVPEIRAAVLGTGEMAAPSAHPALQAAPSAGRDAGLLQAVLAAHPVQQAADSDPDQAQRGKTVRSAQGAADSAAPHEAAQGAPSAGCVPPEAADHSAAATRAEAEEVPVAEAPSEAEEEGNFKAG